MCGEVLVWTQHLEYFTILQLHDLGKEGRKLSIKGKNKQTYFTIFDSANSVCTYMEKSITLI